MTPDRWRRVEAIFHDALARDAGERLAFVATACDGDEGLRRQVEALLATVSSDAGLLDLLDTSMAAFPLLPALAAQVPAADETSGRSLIGQRVGRYDVLSVLGEGGMGRVYRARDTELGRDVAIKVLPAAFVADRDRLARFEREARMLASLNHPNIAAIYGVEPLEGGRALILELIEGETLAQRMVKRGARSKSGLPLDEAVAIAKQIAVALHAAHEQGIVHRDLKPANIHLRPDGLVKVLDFGLAKALDRSGAGTDATHAPTIATATSEAGMVMGTPGYMAPEQARGDVVDQRADVWAFGCVLFEMVGGQQAFGRPTITDTLLAVLTTEPDWACLPPDRRRLTPVLKRCLRKDPTERFQAIGDVRLLLDDLTSNSHDDQPGAGRSAAPGWGVPRTIRGAAVLVGTALVTALVTAFATWSILRRSPERLDSAATVARLQILPAAAQRLAVEESERNIAISPDGRYLVYRSGSPPHLIVRAVGSLESRRLESTEAADDPFFSPDGRWVGFFTGTTLKKVQLAGGSAISICASSYPRGASWTRDGHIVFATQDVTKGLQRVSADGGEPTVLTTPDTAAGERAHRQPSVLPDGRGILFTILPSNPSDVPNIAVLQLDSGRIKTVIQGGSHAEYVEGGFIVYAAGSRLLAVPFDLDALEARGAPVPVIEDLRTGRNYSADYALSSQGTLAYIPVRPSGPLNTLVWIDRNGGETATGAPPRRYAGPRLSPDGSRIAVAALDQNRDVYVFDLRRQTLRQLTFDPALDEYPIWTPDGMRIVFASARTGSSNLAPNLYVQAADGTGPVERLTESRNDQRPAWVGSGEMGIVATEIAPDTAGDVVWFPGSLLGRPAQGRPWLSSEPLVRTRGIDYNPAVSPDGRYLAYQSNESGQEEIYVRPFPRVNSARWLVAPGGGTHPAWSRNGQELYYVDASNSLMAVPVEHSDTALTFGTPARLFAFARGGPYGIRRYDPAADGRFIAVKPLSSDTTPDHIVVVFNWLRDLVAGKTPTEH